MIMNKINMCFIEYEHLRRKQEHCVIINFLVGKESPAIAIVDMSKTNCDHHNYFHLHIQCNLVFCEEEPRRRKTNWCEIFLQKGGVISGGIFHLRGQDELWIS